jgi:alpha,alpha-trehalase
MNQYQEILDYIDSYWEKALFLPGNAVIGNVRNLLLRLGRVRLPYPSVAPNHLYFAGSQYYWDTYFTILGLVDSGRGELAKGMVDNFAYLYQRFRLVPARNALTSIGRTQPPFLTSMIWEIYDSGAADDDWLDKRMQLAATEYEKVWNGGQRAIPEMGLNRYQPRYLRKLLTVYESGWDVSTRFAHGRTYLVPIDLNCFLYKYEADLLRWAKLKNDPKSMQVWDSRAKLRRAAIERYLWDADHGFFYDYDLQTKDKENLNTLAGFFVLWAGVATKAQADACIKKLRLFEYPHGLASTEKIVWKHRQWDYPNGWPPLNYLVIKGLRNYGFEQEANRLTRKWLDLQSHVFDHTHVLWEKYDVVHGHIGRRGRYPTQPGFAWTNGVFLRLLNELKASGK